MWPVGEVGARGASTVIRRARVTWRRRSPHRRPRYRVYRDGVQDPGEPTDVLEQVRDDMVGFLLGCKLHL